MSLERAYDGRIGPFLAPLHRVRPHRGQIETAEIYRKILNGGEIITREKQHVQDPYSFRCIPQSTRSRKGCNAPRVTEVPHTEINSVTDNPTVFPDEDLVLSGGNFTENRCTRIRLHGCSPCRSSNISERRVAQLILGQRGYPNSSWQNPVLTPDS